MIISPDSFLFEGDNVYSWTAERCGEAWKLANKLFNQEMAKRHYRTFVLMCGAPASGKSTIARALEARDPNVLILDACGTNRAVREEYLRVAKLCGFDVAICWADTPLSTCLTRNAERSEDRRVPEHRVREMWESINADPPTEAEATIYKMGSGVQNVA